MTNHRWVPLLSCFVLITSGATAFAAPDDWFIFRGDRSLSGYRDGRLSEELDLLWTFATEAEVRSSPVIAGGFVFVGSGDGNVYALDRASGEAVWTFSTDGGVESPPLYADGTLYLAHLGAYPLQPRDISAAILSNLFLYGSWNLLWYFMLVALLLVFLPACQPVRWTFLWLLVSIAAVIAAMFGLSDEARWAKDSTALNRVLLQVLPVIVCALALVWHSLFQPRVAQQPGADG